MDTCDLEATAAAIRPTTKLLVVETITNPLLRVSDLRSLAEIAHRGGALLLVDNTFASPILCRPLEFGADLVLESLTKIMNGHSDVLLGMLCGREEIWQRSADDAFDLGLEPPRRWIAGWPPAESAHCTCGPSGPRKMRWPRHGFSPTSPAVEVVHYPGLARTSDHAAGRAAIRRPLRLDGHVHLRGGTAAATASSPPPAGFRSARRWANSRRR